MDLLLQKVLEYLNSGHGEEMPPELSVRSSQQFQDAIKQTMKLNNQYHEPEEIVRIMSELTGQELDSTFRLFPPFYTDFGRNIHIGKNVFINSFFIWRCGDLHLIQIYKWRQKKGLVF